MQRNKRSAARLLCALCLLAALPAQALAQPSCNAKAAVLLEADTGKVLYAKNAHERLPMASTTKIMTALIALENGDLTETVEVPRSAYGTEGSSMYLALGEKLTLRDLLYGLMLASGNDAAVTIAAHVGGSVEGFAAMMNERAAALGLCNTHFVTPNGLHDAAHYTSAYDLGCIAACAMRSAAFRDIVATRYYRTESGARVRTLQNKNKVLWQYEGGMGIKTGYTSKAGKCLVFAAERNGMRLIGVLLNAPDMFNQAYALLDYGFAAYGMQTLVRAGEIAARVRVRRGAKNALALAAAEDIMIPVDLERGARVRTQLQLAEVSAPVSAGDAYGVLSLWEEGRLLARTDLVAREDIPLADVRYYFGRFAENWNGA